LSPLNESTPAMKVMEMLRATPLAMAMLPPLHLS
jgi:hypothetical protein